MLYLAIKCENSVVERQKGTIMSRFNLKKAVNNSTKIIFYHPVCKCYEEFVRVGKNFDLTTHSLDDDYEKLLRKFDDHTEYTNDMILRRFNKNVVCYDVVKVTLFHDNRKTKLGFVEGRLVSKETSIIY